MTPQAEAVLRALERGNLTSLDALRLIGTSRLAARCWELRQEGYPVETVYVRRRTRAGMARVAEYRMAPK